MANIKTIRFRNYKSFKSEYFSIDMKPVTVLIGKNNCGKSSCIDIIEALSDAKLLKNQNSDIIIDSECLETELVQLYESQGYRKNCHPDIKNYIDKTMSFKLKFSNNSHAKIYRHKTERIKNDQIFDDNALNWDSLSGKLDEFLQMIVMRRLDAERDIVPEPYSDDETLSKNGNGACNLINRVLNYSKHNERLIQYDLLKALNNIMYPDSKFNGITVQKVENESDDKWEVYLYEGEDRFPLSKTGTGLKTVILVLLNLLVIPKIQKYSDDNLKIFAFEELENNLHPALQRRLFDYINQYVNEHKHTYVFLTTHSHIAINTFVNNENSQILHILKEDGVSSIHKIDDFISKCEVLNDLDVRASDLLQSNGIIWVEGPSDRVYIKRWLEIWGDTDLIEGRDYQFLYYGGRLLSHYTANKNHITENQESSNQLIDILTTNRNSAIVIDSDKKSPRAKINETKTRIKQEFKDKSMFCWITQGKEIENYIPFKAINNAYNVNLSQQCQMYELFPKYIEKIRKHFPSEKVEFANKVCPFINIENAHILDIETKIKELCITIKKWNYK